MQPSNSSHGRSSALTVLLLLGAACEDAKAPTSVDPACGAGGRSVDAGQASELGFRADDVLAIALEDRKVATKLRCEGGPCDAFGPDLSWHIVQRAGPVCVNYDCSDRASEPATVQERAKYCERAMFVPVLVKLADNYGTVVERSESMLRARTSKEATLTLDGKLALPTRLPVPSSTTTYLGGEIRLGADGSSRGSVHLTLSSAAPPGGQVMEPRVNWEFLGEP